MNSIDTLLALEEIKKLKAIYFRCMDLKLWDELAMVFTEDVLFDVRGALELPRPDDQYEEEIIQGRDNAVSHISTGLSPMTSVHHGMMPEIEIIDDGNARGIWPMTDVLIPPEGAPFTRFQGWGHYRETYRKVAGRWQIATLRLRRLHVEIS